MELAFLIAAGAAGAAGLGYLALRADPAWPLSIGIALSVFSGNWAVLGVPVGLDRLLLVAGIAGLLLQPERRRRVRIHGIHWVMLVALAWAAASAAAAGTLFEQDGMFGLLDRFGLIPFALFVVAPVAFEHARQRAVLLGTLVVTGAYLGLTTLFEALGLDALVVPGYITDPSVGIHAERARGPFVEAVANGMALYACAVAAGIAFTQARDALVRAACAAVAALCLAGTLFTLTRSVWLATAVASATALVAFRETRRLALPALAGGGLVVAVLLAAVPGLSQDASEREGDESPLWVRENTNEAALRIVEERPLTGVGWSRFEEESRPYFEQSGDTPLEGLGEGVHNVLLSRASELGLVGAFLWLAAAAGAVAGALVSRGPPELRPWKIGLAALAVHWLVVGAVTPLPYVFPTLALFAWAGVAASRAVRTQAFGPAPVPIRA